MSGPFLLREEIDANRRFVLQAYRSNPALQALVEESAGLQRGDWSESTALPDVPNDERAERLGRRPASADF